MKILPDSLFGRLFALVLSALLVSHLSFALVMIFAVRNAGGPNTLAPPANGLPPPLIGLAVQFLILSAVTLLGSRLLVKPIEDLANASQKLGLNLDAPPMSAGGPKELRLAANTFNEMQTKIKWQLEERSRFLAVVSHDLRTPLTRMRIRIEQIDRFELKNALRADIHEMSGMLDSTLNYIRSSTVQETWQSLDLVALVETMVDNASEQGGRAEYLGQVQPVPALPMALRRGLQNLVDNALRYAGDVQIGLSEQNGIVKIEVRDHGPGIPETELTHVLEPFVRLESSRNRMTGGSGLGLSIARDAALRHGGSLTLSNAEDGGLLATLTVPRQPHVCKL